MPAAPLQDGGSTTQRSPSGAPSPQRITPTNPLPAPRPAPTPTPAPAPVIHLPSPTLAAPRPSAPAPTAPRPASPAPAAPLSANDQQFIQWFTSIYQKFLGRNPEPAAIQNAVNAWNFFNAKGGNSQLGGTGVQAGTGIGELAGGQDMPDIAWPIATSPEAWRANRFANGLNPTTAASLINQDYQSMLNRPPEQEAFEDAMVALLGGFETPQQFQSNIQASPEFLRLHPPVSPTPPPPPPPGGTAPPPAPQGPGPVEPGLVRFNGLNEFDPNYAQNLAVMSGGQLVRPLNVLSFDPFSKNPFAGPGIASVPSGGGNAPIVGNPETLQTEAFRKAGGQAPLPTNPTPAAPTAAQPTPPPVAPVQLGQNTVGQPSGQGQSPAQATAPPPALRPVTNPLPAASTPVVNDTTPNNAVAPITTGAGASLMQQVNRNLFQAPRGAIMLPGL